MSTNDVCASCESGFDSRDQSVQCAECSASYHFGTCSSLTEKQYRSKSVALRQKWACPTCKAAKNNDGVQSDTAVRNETAEVRLLLCTINQKLDGLMPLKETVLNIERAVQMMSEKYDELLNRLENQERQTKEIHKKVDAIEVQCKMNADEKKALQVELNDLEWRNRKLNLEFHGIQVTESENLLQKVNNLADVMNVPKLSEMEVAAIHRLPAKPGKIPGIIVRYVRQAVRDQWLEKRHKLKEEGCRVIVLENLTSCNRQLLKAAKEWAKENGFQYAWHRNGRVFVRKTNGERAIVVRNTNDFPV